MLVGCAKSPPKCSDPEVIGLVTNLFSEHIGAIDDITIEQIKKTLVVSLSRASAFDEKIKKYSCEATLAVGGTLETPIKYVSQLDDKNELIVAIEPLKINRADAIQIARAISAAIPSQAKPNLGVEAGLEKEAVPKMEPQELPFKSRCGVVAKGENNSLVVGGKPTTPPINAGYSLEIVDYLQQENSDVLLVRTNSGGTACPSMYHYVTLSQDGAKSTEEFGTCSDLIKTYKSITQGIIATLPTRDGPNRIFMLKNG